MSAPFRYQIVFDQTTNDVAKFTAEIHTALNKVDSYNFDIKVCEAKRKQATQIAANLTNSVDFNSTEALDDIGKVTKINLEIEDIVSERTKLENERRIVLRSVDEAIQHLAEQREIAHNLATQLEGGNQYEDALIAIAKWDVDIAYLQLRRDAVGQNA